MAQRAETVPAAPATTTTQAAPPTTTTPATTTPTVPTTTTPPPATTPSGGAEAPAPGAGDEEGIRVPARFTVSGARVTPGRVDVPAFLAVTLTLVSADGREHTLGIATPNGGVRMHVAAGETSTRTVPGLSPGDYLVSLDGAATDSTLHVG